MRSERLIVVRQYSKDDYSDLMGSGYPFGSYLRPDFRGWVKNFFSNQREIGKFLLETFFLNQEDATLVAYSPEENKTVGVVRLGKITNHLWGIWEIFVSPAYRGRRIASLLYQASFRFLRRQKVRKATIVVSLNNIASVKSIKRNWQGFLSSKIFKCFGKLPIEEPRRVKIAVKKLHRGDRINLFEIFKKCVGKQWSDYLEITKGNYLDRIFGAGYIEPVGRNPLARLAVKKNVFVAEYENKLCGYAISREIWPFHIHYALLQFIPPSENFEDISKALLLEALRQFQCETKHKFTFVQIGNEGIKQRLKNISFKVEENLVGYKCL